MGAEVDQANTESLYPNPFSQSSTISFTLEEGSYVNIDLFDLAGSKIVSIASRQFEEGEYQIPFDRKNISSGIYILQMKVNQKTVLIKIAIQ